MMVTGHTLLFSIEPARKPVNRALILSEKSLTVNGFACLGYGYQQTPHSLEPRTSNFEPRVNRALILFEKSLTVNNFTGLGYGY